MSHGMLAILSAFVCSYHSTVVLDYVHAQEYEWVAVHRSGRWVGAKGNSQPHTGESEGTHPHTVRTDCGFTTQ